jgi:hypothetical protein
MITPTDKVPSTRSAVKRSAANWHSPRARIFYNILRVIVGALILSSIRYAGPLAFLGLLPLAWAAVGFWWIYRHRDPAPN